MSTQARLIIGVLLALVIGLGVGLAIVAGDDGADEATTIITPTVTRSETGAAPTQPTQDVTPPAPTPTAPPDGTGGLGPSGE